MALYSSLLVDIFNSLNLLNISLQGKEDNIFCVYYNIEAILKNLSYEENIHFKTILATFQLFLHF